MRITRDVDPRKTAIYTTPDRLTRDGCPQTVGRRLDAVPFLGARGEGETRKKGNGERGILL